MLQEFCLGDWPAHAPKLHRVMGWLSLVVLLVNTLWLLAPGPLAVTIAVCRRDLPDLWQ